MKALDRKTARVILAFIIIPILVIVATAAMAAPVKACVTCCKEKTVAAKATKCHSPKKHHKKAAPKKSAPAVTPFRGETSVAANGCAEIHFFTKAQEPAVQVGFFTSGKADTIAASDACMAKNAVVVDCGPKELCDFTRAATVLGGTFPMTKTYPTTAGEHVLYVPQKFLDPKSSILTCLVLVRGNKLPPVWNEPAQYSPATARKHNADVLQWMNSHYSDLTCIDPPSYSFKGIATVWHSEAEMPPGSRIQTYFRDAGKSLFD